MLKRRYGMSRRVAGATALARMAKTLAKRGASSARKRFGARKRPAAAGKTRYAKKARTTRRKESIIRPPPSGGLGHSTCYIVKRRSPGKLLGRMSAPCTVYDDDSFLIQNSNLGYQAYGYSHGSLTGELEGNHVATLFNNARDYLATTTGLSASTLSVSQQSYKMLINSVIQTMAITNMESTSVRVDIWDVVAKQAGHVSYSDPIPQWALGLAAQKPVTPYAGITDPLTFPRSVPTTSYIFNKNWKVVKRTAVELGPGQSHEHVLVYKVNSVVDTEIISDLTDTNARGNRAQLAGLTHHTIITLNGIVVESGTASGLYTLSSTKLGIVSHRKTMVRLLTSAPRLSQYIDVNNHANDSAERYYNVGSGAIATGAAAA